MRQSLVRNWEECDFSVDLAKCDQEDEGDLRADRSLMECKKISIESQNIKEEQCPITMKEDRADRQDGGGGGRIM